jgi:pyochelin synthetase
VIELLGRKNTEVTINGHCVEAAQVESVIQTHPTVGSAAVVSDGRNAVDGQLVAFVAGARRPDPGDDDLDFRRVMAEAGRAMSRTISHRQILQFTAALDRAELVSMVSALRSFGLFRTSHDAYHRAEILTVARVPPAHHGLIHRWLDVLVGERLLAEDVDGRLRLIKLLDPRSTARAWDNVEELRTEEICPAQMMSYLRASAEQLPALMTGVADPARMFFPEGQLRIAQAMYADNALARYLNQVVAATVRRIASAQPDGIPLRVLEIGAGIGATTAHVIAALSGRTADYLFTDTSQFLISRAKKMFGHHRWMRFSRFDVNRDPRAQGLRPHSFNVVICVGQLGVAADVEQALSWIRQLLVTCGVLVLLEPTRQHYETMTSTAFMINESAESRGEEGATVLTRERWLATLRGPGDEVTLCLPTPAHPLSRLGQHVFVTQVKRDTAAVDTTELTKYVATRLPRDMVPADIRVVDALPLCGNGKIDRARLRSWLSEPSCGHGTTLRTESSHCSWCL